MVARRIEREGCHKAEKKDEVRGVRSKPCNSYPASDRNCHWVTLANRHPLDLAVTKHTQREREIGREGDSNETVSRRGVRRKDGIRRWWVLLLFSPSCIFLDMDWNWRLSLRERETDSRGTFNELQYHQYGEMGNDRAANGNQMKRKKRPCLHST